MLKKIALTLSVIALTGCNSAPENQVNCHPESWQLTGENTASKGQSIRHFDNFINYCGERLPVNAKAEFIQGYTKGLAEYCTYTNGYEQGIANLALTNICPAERRTAFVNGHKTGSFNYRKKIHELEAAKDYQDSKNTRENQDISDSVTEL